MWILLPLVCAAGIRRKRNGRDRRHCVLKMLTKLSAPGVKTSAQACDEAATFFSLRRMNLLSSPQHPRGQPFTPLEWCSCNQGDSALSIQPMFRRSSRDWLINSRRTKSDTAPSSSHRPESTDTTGSTLHRQRSSETPPLRLQDSDPSPAVENHSVNSERNHVMVERAETVLAADNGTRFSAAAAATASAAPAYTVTATATGFPGDVHDRRSGGRTRQASYPSLAPRSESGASSSSSKSAIAARASEWKRRIQERGLGAKAEEIVSDRPRPLS